MLKDLRKKGTILLVFAKFIDLYAMDLPVSGQFSHSQINQIRKTLLNEN